MADFDLAIIGGGINGAGLASDAAGRGIRVLLVEMNDLGSGHVVSLQQDDPWRVCVTSSMAPFVSSARR